jgi:uncharacterized membrane protein YqjE
MRILEPTISKNRFQSVYLAGILLFVMGMPLSKAAMSIALLILAVHWLLSRGYRYVPSIQTPQGKAFLLFLLIPVIHIIGLSFTTDFQFALKDLRIKMPLLLLPLFIVTGPKITQRQFVMIFYVFVAAVLAGTLWGLRIYLVDNPVNARDITPFISHIRFSLMVTLATVVAGGIAFRREENGLIRIGAALIAVWFAVFLLLLESLTGVFTFVLVIVMILVVTAFRGRKRWLKIGSIMLLLLIAGGGVALYHKASREFKPTLVQHPDELEPRTARNHLYMHDLSSPVNENGNLVWIYVCKEEMREIWNTRSIYPFDGTLPNGSYTSDVLLRFLSSKGLRKDAEGVSSLTDDDIASVERGITNYRYEQWSGMRKRYDQLKWEYWNYAAGGDARGHSLMQRLELWRVGLDLAGDHLLTGVGTGDLKNEFASRLELRESSLSGTKLRAHNQYITILITFGLPGFFLFIAALTLPLLLRSARIGIEFSAFLIIALTSMLIEDTLETQAGVSFFAFFYALWLFQELSNGHLPQSQYNSSIT